MAETNAPGPEGCPQYGEELPLLAVGSLDRDCADLLRKHLADCPGCRASYEAYCRVLETVKGELEPDRPLDTERVLARLRERMGKPSGSGSGGAEGERPVKLLVSMALIVVGVVALLILTRPGTAAPSLTLPEAPDAALLYVSRQPGGRQIKGGDAVQAVEGSVRLRFAKVEVRLKQGGSLRVKENGLELLAGVVAVNVPKDSSFAVSVPSASAAVKATPECRFAVELAAPAQVAVTVAEGQVSVEHARGATALPAGQQASFSAKGVDGAPVAVDARKAFGWLGEELYKGLKLELSVLRPARVSLVLKNVSNGPIGVTGYHPLGVNYQLELRRPASPGPEFVKLVPSLLRVQRAPGVIESVHETLGQIVIEPGQAFELEMDLSALLAEPGTYRVAAEYLGFGPAGGSAAELGLLLRSNEVQVVIAAPRPGAAPQK